MNKQNEYSFSDHTALRQRAEARLKETQVNLKKLLSEADMLKVIHELQVHQIELQIQNEELLQAKEWAETAEKKYSELYESAPCGYLTLSSEGDILELNFGAAQLLHKERSLLINSRLAFFFSDATRAVFQKFLDKLGGHRAKESCEVKIETEGWISAFVKIDGIRALNDQTLLLSMVDITKSKQVEDSLRQLEIDKVALKFKQTFLANLSHELRTPLTGLLGMIDILEHTALSIEQKDYIQTLRLSGENLRIIINQVLDFAKIEAGKVKLTPVTFKFNSLLYETLSLFKGSVKGDVKFSIQADPKIPEFIFADKSRIQQVLNNLVANAVKFTREGSVILSSELLNPNASSKQVLIKIGVTDTGIGIPDKMQKKLFTPFSQIDDSDTREYEGTGLGLAICKELTTLLGGQIGLVSTYHKGSTFWFIIPVKHAENPQNLIEPTNSSEDSLLSVHAEQSKRKLRILFADDKMINQKVISLLLSSMGHTVTLASNGKEAVNLFQPGLFDLILMDIQMPIMDGVTATQKIKQKFKDPPPIVGLTASAMQGDRDKFMALGMDEYLTKPFGKEEFNVMVAQMIG